MKAESVIAVGSARKPKLAALRETLDELAAILADEKAIEIVGVEVESGVNHTPLDSAESMRDNLRKHCKRWRGGNPSHGISLLDWKAASIP